jgi:hypothetical protein
MELNNLITDDVIMDLARAIKKSAREDTNGCEPVVYLLYREADGEDIICVETWCDPNVPDDTIMWDTRGYLQTPRESVETCAEMLDLRSRRRCIDTIRGWIDDYSEDEDII